MILLVLPIVYAKPDLYLAHMQDETDEIRIGDRYQPTFVFKNKGDDDIDQEICISTYVNGIRLFDRDVPNRWHIEAGGRYRLGIPFGPYTVPGVRNVVMKLDHGEQSCDNLLDEEDETNNEYNFSFNVRELTDDDCVIRNPSYQSDYEQNTLIKGGITMTDHCYDEKTLIQYECDDEKPFRERETDCTYGCKNGRCLHSFEGDRSMYMEQAFYPTSSDGHNFDITVFVDVGWNLVFPIDPKGIKEASDIHQRDIKSAYFFNTFQKKFFIFFPEQNSDEIIEENTEMLNESHYGYFANTAIWVYSKKAGYLISSRVDTAKLHQIQFKKGWNTVGINPEMTSPTGIDFDEINGNCTITKAYMFDTRKNGWINMINSSLKTRHQAKGLVLKVDDDCTLGYTNPTGPPSLPN